MKIMLSGRQAGKFYPWLERLISLLIQKPGVTVHIATLPDSYNFTFRNAYRVLQNIEKNVHFPYWFSYSSEIGCNLNGFSISVHKKRRKPD